MHSSRSTSHVMLRVALPPAACLVVCCLLQKERLQRPARCPDQLWQLIEACWAQDPRDRPSFADTLQTLQRLQQQLSQDQQEAAAESNTGSSRQQQQQSLQQQQHDVKQAAHPEARAAAGARYHTTK
jgi:hypothetical protein